MDCVSSMQFFVKVVDNGGFAAAARQLNLSPSLVTTHIKSLEDHLGVRLLDRNTRKVSLTEVGQAYYERCLQILYRATSRPTASSPCGSRPCRAPD